MQAQQLLRGGNKRSEQIIDLDALRIADHFTTAVQLDTNPRQQSPGRVGFAGLSVQRTFTGSQGMQHGGIHGQHAIALRVSCQISLLL